MVFQPEEEWPKTGVSPIRPDTQHPNLEFAELLRSRGRTPEHADTVAREHHTDTHGRDTGLLVVFDPDRDVVGGKGPFGRRTPRIVRRPPGQGRARRPLPR